MPGGFSREITLPKPTLRVQVKTQAAKSSVGQKKTKSCQQTRKTGDRTFVDRESSSTITTQLPDALFMQSLQQNAATKPFASPPLPTKQNTVYFEQ